VEELFGLAEATGLRPLRNLGRVLAALVPIVVVLTVRAPRLWLVHQWAWLLIIGFIVVIGTAVFTRAPSERPLASVAITVFGVGYAALLPVTAFVIRHGQWGERSWPGTAMVFFPFVVTWICDSAAMLGGRAMGGAKMAPVISPGKTWSGGIAGAVAGTVAGIAYALLVFPRVHVPIGVVPALILALILSIVGQIGDLAESLFKREAGVKDSSALIPGHGGVLDRLDSLYFVLPVTAAGYYLLGLV
ncbi:MAG: phosphatidate cytidylyltransferase, partial [Gemmatimonadales bacterium]